MIVTVLISALTCLAMIMAVLFFPKIRVGRLALSSYWLITLAGAFLLLLTKRVAPRAVTDALLANTAINPLKILVLFISMTLLSIFLFSHSKK